MAENLHEAQSLVEDWDTKLDEVLSAKSMGQNHAKKEHMVRFVGKGAAVEMRKAYQEKLRIQGKMMTTVRYLGGWLSSNGRNGTEIRKRKEAAHVGWKAMGGLWSNCLVPLKVKITVFQCLVRNALLSGLECVCLKKTEVGLLERTQNWYLCRLSRRGMKTADGEGNETWKSERMEVLRERLGIPSVQSELQARRVKWLQQIGKRPEEYLSMLAALTGTYSWDPTEQLAEDGWASEHANPWLAQFLEDVRAVCAASTEVAEEVGPLGWRGVFSSWAFLKFNSARLRGYVAEAERGKKEGGEAKEEEGWEGEQTSRQRCHCGREFRGKQALALHQFGVHGMARIRRGMMVNNQCPWCERTFTVMDNGVTQRQHLKDRLRTGRCARRRGPAGAGLTRVEEPRSLVCPGCQEETNDKAELFRHIRRHLEEDHQRQSPSALDGTSMGGEELIGGGLDSARQEAGSGSDEGRRRDAGCGGGEGCHRLGREGPGHRGCHVQDVPPSKGARCGSGRSSGRGAVQPSSTGSGQKAPARTAVPMDIRRYVGINRSRAADGGREERTSADPAFAPSRANNLPRGGAVVHLQGAVQGRGLQVADLGLRQRQTRDGVHLGVRQADRRGGEVRTGPAGACSAQHHQAAEGTGTLGGAGLSAATQNSRLQEMDAGDTETRTEPTSLQQNDSRAHETMDRDHGMRNHDDDSDHRDAGSTGSCLQEGSRTAGSGSEQNNKRGTGDEDRGKNNGCMDGSDEGAGRGRLKRSRGSRGNSEEKEEDKGAWV